LSKYNSPTHRSAAGQIDATSIERWFVDLRHDSTVRLSQFLRVARLAEVALGSVNGTDPPDSHVHQSDAGRLILLTMQSPFSGASFRQDDLIFCRRKCMENWGSIELEEAVVNQRHD
jgi:hypothetical protein